jgi:hypothetical protein
MLAEAQLGFLWEFDKDGFDPDGSGHVINEVLTAIKIVLVNDWPAPHAFGT